MEVNDKYRNLGFRCGLEIHQQLLTERKLFCRCPAGYRNDKPHGEIIRHMRPTLSELGEYDGTALMEFKTRKNVVYQLYRESACTYEMDDTPPFPINPQALEIALKLAMLLNCAIVDELHVSRKQYLDGSIPTGFQRTAIVGVNGWIPFKSRRITITHLCLEEDACREIRDVGHEIVWRTDRLSMPLLEVITAPELMTPTEAMDVDAAIGRLLKASGLVRRGIGSVRQDVNVSIAGGNRAEIKGVPQTRMIEKLTAVEAERQAALLQIRGILRERAITDRDVRAEEFDMAGSLRNFSIPAIESALARGWVIKAVRFDGFAGIFGFPTQPGLTLADEIAGRLRVIACLDRMPNLAISDIPDMAGFNSEIWQEIKAFCSCGPGDAVILTWGPPSDVGTALSETIIRAIEAARGVPHETRQALKNGNTDFERILPGPDRMYPDTDSPPVEITKLFLDKLRSELPEPAYETETRWITRGVPRDIAYKAVVSPFAGLFDDLVCRRGMPAIFVWTALRHLDKETAPMLQSLNGIIAPLFDAHKAGLISRDSLFDLLGNVGRNGSKPIDRLIEENRRMDCQDSAIRDLICEFVDETSDSAFRSHDDRINYICGRVKERVGHRLDGVCLQNEVAARIK
jgi:glutamyl-tRNA(Gln) amidotransferase subunit E